MKTMEIHELGEIIRKTRKDRGLRLEDLADDNISPATISNIERGVPHVSMDKTYYLLDKLELKLEEIPELLLKEKEELTELRDLFIAAETLIDAGSTDKAQSILDKIELDDKHPYASTKYFLQGKCYMSSGKLKRAERNYYRAIQLSSGEETKTNIETASFSELGFIQYKLNNLEQALKFTDSGIDAYRKTGEREYLWPLLNRNKAIYLERLGRLAESMRVVQGIWDHLNTVQDVETVLSFYWLRAEILRRMGIYQEALQFAYEGEELARRNKNYYSTFTLWELLGSIHMNLRKWEKAEFCFVTALELEKCLNEDQKRSLTNSYSRLGIVYMRQGKTEEAFSMIKNAISNANKYNDAPRLINSHLIMGNFRVAHNDRNPALNHYKEALDLSLKYNLKHKELQVTRYLANYWEGVNEEEFQKAIRNIYVLQQDMQSDEEDLLDDVSI
ncbi:helix-turn-helix transcriptional regulator [Desmospora profundinema]|uniref:Tetratricopeptide (TPR) repeat protein n=1 Tax=Desmospora profundinema TaxID=1571184 RepID=A0ABU1IQ03_9BACL|nr:helix-turn-helix transcriptional regulator [Desmospora profundinema]MDR6226876.1 tetratricopeptide (TPR) repeat protein [Desmospora profundinema]